MTRLKVLAFHQDRMVSLCKVLASDQFYIGQELWVDLIVNADFGNMSSTDLIGKIVTVDRFQACEYIGIDVKVVEE